MARPKGSGLVPLWERFRNKVTFPTEPNGCWVWQGSNSKGYGEIQVERPDRPNGWGTKRATHVAWFLEHGEWPTQWMLHKCHTPSCVNPNHLYEGTVLENNRDIHQRTRDLIAENERLKLRIEELEALLEVSNG